MPSTSQVTSQEYVLIGWNDLGMHCMNQNYQDLCILPPYNNLKAQLIKRGNPPQLINSNVALNYQFQNNTYSTGKVNFWTYAKQLFGVTLADNTGLTGNGLTGTMKWNDPLFEATGVPLTPFEDNSTTEQPYQLADVTASDASGKILDKTTFVTPVSVEIHCDTCHTGGGGSAESNILRLHDEEEGTALSSSKPVLCANCHQSNALGTKLIPGIPPLSQAIHGKHAEELGNSTSCYSCHPGIKTKCLRDAMFSAGKTCTDCHGSLSNVASTIKQGRRPWLDEPKCASCHDATHAENSGKLYRNSTGHGGLYCTACHNSPHAIVPSVEPRDNIQAIRLQGAAKPLKNCLICHATAPTGSGPHGLKAEPVSVDMWETFN